MRVPHLLAAAGLMLVPGTSLACDLDGYGGHRFFAFADMMAKRQQDLSRQEQQPADRQSQPQIAQAQPRSQQEADSSESDDDRGADDGPATSSAFSDDASWSPSDEEGRVDPSATFR